MELTYHRKGDYLFPNLIIKEETVAIGKYGMLRKTFLKEHRKNCYPAPEKESDPMAWTAHMNSLTAMAEESILTELVYS